MVAGWVVRLVPPSQLPVGIGSRPSLLPWGSWPVQPVTSFDREGIPLPTMIGDGPEAAVNVR